MWENKLRRIERGEYSPAEFIDELKAMIHQIVLSVLSDNTNRKIIVDSGGNGSGGSDSKPAAKKEKEKAACSGE